MTASRHRQVTAGLGWCAAFGLYLLFAGQPSGSELGAGAVLATLATGWSVLVRRCGSGSFRGRRAHWRPLLAGLRKLLPATLRTGLVLARVATRGGSPGRPMLQPFARGDRDDPRDRARRATALLVASLAPDSFVLRAAPERSEVLLHAIVPPGGDPDPRWLI